MRPIKGEDTSVSILDSFLGLAVTLAVPSSYEPRIKDTAWDQP